MKKILIFVVALFLGVQAKAQWTVHDPIALANSISQQGQTLAKWIEQKEQMVQQILHLKEIVAFQNKMEQIQGDIRNVANTVMAPANEVMALQQSLMQVPTLESIRSTLNPTRTLVTGFKFRVERGAPGQYFMVNDNVVWRDPNRYKGYEAERMALQNQEQAYTQQETLEKKELAEILRNQRTLSGSPTQAQATVALAAIEASKARLETMNLRTMRAAEASKHLAQQRAMEDSIVQTTVEEEQLALQKDQQAKAESSLAAQKNFRFVRR